MSGSSEGIGALPSLLCSSAPAAVQSDDCADRVVCLFDELSGRILLYLLAFGLPRQDAEDVVQETFLALFQHLKLGRSRQNLRGWLFRVAHHLALKRRQANRRFNRPENLEEILSSQPDRSAAADVALDMDQRHRRFQGILKALPERDRLCILLRADGMRYREIAQVVGISLGAVSLSVSRTLTRMARSQGETR
jgi:RNA polymerase sigma-70 factor (ECF subfamily)